MTATSFYTRLSAELTADYQQKAELFRKHSILINRFSEAIKSFRLTPHVRPDQKYGIALVAVSNRGDNAQALIRAMHAHGIAIGIPERTPTQFDDGFVIWTADALVDDIDFTLVFYTARNAP